MIASRLKQFLILFFALSFSIEILPAGRAGAESELRIPYPKETGVIDAVTYDEEGLPVGAATLAIEVLETGHIKMKIKSGFDGGAKQVIEAELAPIESAGEAMLQLLHERSQSFDPKGKPLVILEIDHKAGTASCTSPDGGESSTIDLPQPDRVANVPLNLLFVPLVEGIVDQIETQVFFCLGGARSMRFAGRAVNTPSLIADQDSSMRKIIYEPNLGGMFNWAAKAMAPQILFWFDPEDQSRYLAHRLPLYSKGPVVYVIRSGVSAAAIVRSGQKND